MQQNTLFCKNYEKSRKIKKLYLLEKISYEDVRHGFRKLRRPSLSKKQIFQDLVDTCRLNLPFWPKEKYDFNKITKNIFINTVLGYKKGLKTVNIFLFCENILFQLSNALSIVLISLKLVKIQQDKHLSVAPPTGSSAPYGV